MKVIGVFIPMIVIAIVVLVVHSLATPHPSVAELNATATKVTWLCRTCGSRQLLRAVRVNGIGMAFVLGGSVLHPRGSPAGQWRR